MMTRAIYALSGDPITNGHMDIINRARAVFDKVIVAIGFNAEKRYLFNIDERTQMAELATQHLPNVEVQPFNGMLSDFAIESGAEVIIRGVRNATDFEFEQNVHNVGLTQNRRLETMLIMCNPSLAHISSSVVKGLVESGGDISDYVPMVVKCFMEQRMTHKVVVGVTGSIACGKSTIAEKLAERQNWTNIDLDHLAHEILSGQDLTRFERNTLDKVFEAFPTCRMSDGSADRKVLAQEVFGELQTHRRKLLEDILRDAISLRIKRKIREADEGIIMLNSALIVEQDLMSLCNNRVVVIEASKDVQLDRLMEVRGLTYNQAVARLESQLHPDTKKRMLDDRIEEDGFGAFITINTDDLDLEIPAVVNKLAEDINSLVTIYNVDKLVG